MPVKRSYAEIGDACATAHGMELLGDVWTYPILRELLLAPKRFGELQSAVIGVTPAVLTARLKQMEAQGLLRRRELPAPARVQVYEVTPWAASLEPVLHGLARWAHGSPAWSPAGGLTPDAAALAIRAMAPDAPHDPPLHVVLRLADRRQGDPAGYAYDLSWGADGVRIARAADDGVAAIALDSTDLAQVLFAGRPLDDVEVGAVGAADAAAVATPRKALAAFVDAFRTALAT